MSPDSAGPRGVDVASTGKPGSRRIRPAGKPESVIMPVQTTLPLAVDDVVVVAAMGTGEGTSEERRPAASRGRVPPKRNAPATMAIVRGAVAIIMGGLDSRARCAA